MDLRRLVDSLEMRSLILGAALALVSCAGKSSRDGGEDDDGRGGSGNAGSGGSAARGGTSGAGARGGTGTGGTSNSLVTRVLHNPANKLDLLFMIDNSISMADKQRLLAEAVPVLVQRLVDPICIDSDGNPVGGTTSLGCGTGQPEFVPMRDIHIGVITSSLGNHGGEVCTADPAESPPRTLNDQAQLLASVRPGLYSYNGMGFLAWDPRMGQETPVPDPHPGKGSDETNPDELGARFAEHVSAAGERGCGYESSLEAWYRFLVDPEPVSVVTNDGQFSVRGPINQVVLEQRARFMRPDSILGIVMLTDENDCSIIDENGQQGWLVGSRTVMPRSSDACAHPEDPNVYRCCIPCVLLAAGSGQPGCDYTGDVACNTPPDPDGSGGHYLTRLEDSTNLRCYDQVRRFGLDWLYPWERYVDALTTPRIALRPPSTGDFWNPIFTPGADGTPARDGSQVFLVGIVGVPWQDIATPATVNGRALRFQTSHELAANGRWDMILGDPEQGIPPTDPFMLESIDARSGVHPVTGENIADPQNDINGHEQNVVNRDDLQYACTFDLVPDVPCTMANQDGCDCNASERAYDRPTCEYPDAEGTDGVQTHAKAYPSTRHLQVLKGLGDNAVVASICPKNVVAQGDPSADPDYGYNPAVSAIVDRVKQSFHTSCLAREFETTNGALACDVIEVRNTAGDACSCGAPGRAELSSATERTIEDELIIQGYCGGNTGIECSSYCLCEIEQFAGDELSICQNVPVDPGTQFGFCYVDPDNGIGSPELTAGCPPSERRLVRFMGTDLPAPLAAAFIVCRD